MALCRDNGGGGTRGVAIEQHRLADPRQDRLDVFAIRTAFIKRRGLECP